ncbi:RNA polymerase sigma-70 factor [Longibacter sp.]|uniref:RNA polymerase sigma-70 factor n=1 Tax=Longibacter sp. TaxID=2045415 RepID=UPI003EB88CA9
MQPDDTELFEEQRERLFGLAYRMLGTVAAAEDMVQDAYVRWHDVDSAAIENPSAYLTTVVTRLCLDELKSARKQRDAYTGPWLPAPIVAERNATLPSVERDNALSMALLVVLEALSPVQRAVFVLREGFDIDYSTIARIVHRSPEHCRKIAQRARAHVGARNRRYSTSRDEQEALVQAFVDAIEDGDPEQLGTLLAEDAISYSDGGGEVTAALRPIYGRERITRFLLGLARKARPDTRIERVSVNGDPGFTIYVEKDVQSVWSFASNDNGQIDRLFTVLNPQKLSHVR